MRTRIFIDLDGTLLKSDLSISDKNKEYIIKAIENGYEIVLTSGRPILFVDYIASIIDDRIKTIGFNGAYHQNKICLTIDHKYIEKIFMQAQNLNIKLMFKTYDTIYCNTKVNERFLYHTDAATLVKYHEFVKFEDIKNLEVFKILGIYGEYEDEFVNSLFDDKLINLESYTRKGFEITNKNANKGNAIKKYCAEYNIDEKKQYYFGDDVNDISMFKNNGNNYVMSQAIPLVKDLATFICDNQLNEGVANGICNILGGNESHE